MLIIIYIINHISILYIVVGGVVVDLSFRYTISFSMASIDKVEALVVVIALIVVCIISSDSDSDIDSDSDSSSSSKT